ncbi:TerB family tellurite resistance protein [Piscinibacter sakaiensis]|uniref:tellurite resistance TerB family protein n=1 Tax=Piscinibacter sakaiensis TaxID=1547922 RepID=UPI003AAAA8F0
MLKSLKDLFDRMIAPASESPAEVEHGLQLATAVLLVEVMRSDPEVTDAERHSVVDTLRERFALTADEGSVLLELAERTSREATDLFSFTSRINESFTIEQKVEMIEAMWRVAYADGHLDAHENHVMRRFADLLHVPHGAYANAKMRARGAG